MATFGPFTFDTLGSADESEFIFTTSRSGATGVAASGTTARWCHDVDETPSAGVGPIGGEGGNPDGYLFTEASSPGAAGDTYTVEFNKTLDGNEPSTLQFYLSARGTVTTSQVEVQISEDGGAFSTISGGVILVSSFATAVSAGTAPWTQFDFDLGAATSADMFRVRLVVTIQGNPQWHCDIGLDSITITGEPPSSVSRLDGWTAGPVSGADFSFPVSSGDNRCVVLAVSAEGTVGSVAINSATYGGVAMTPVDDQITAGGSVGQATRIFILDEAGIASAVGTTVSVSYTDITADQVQPFIASYQDVDQSQLIEDSNNQTSGDDGGDTPAYSVATADKGVVIAVAGSGNPTDVITWALPLIKQVQTEATSSNAAIGEALTDGSSVSVDPSFTNVNRSTSSAVSLRHAAGGILASLTGPTEASTSRQVDHSKSDILSSANETSSARSVEGAIKSYPFSTALSSSSSRTFSHSKSYALVRADELSSARLSGHSKSYDLVRTTESVSARQASPTKSTSIDRSLETAQSGNLTAARSYDLGRSQESSSSRDVAQLTGIIYGNTTTHNDSVDSSDKAITFTHDNDGEDVLIVAMAFSPTSNADEAFFDASYDGVPGVSLVAHPEDFQDDIPRIEVFLVEDASQGVNNIECDFALSGGADMSGFIVFAFSISGLTTGIGANVLEIDTGDAGSTSLSGNVNVTEIGSSILAVGACQNGTLSFQGITSGAGYTDRTDVTNSGGGGTTNFMALAFSQQTTATGDILVDCSFNATEQASLVAIELLQDPDAVPDETVGRSVEASSARSFVASKDYQAGRADDASSSRAFATLSETGLERETEASSSRSISAIKSVAITRASESSSAENVSHSKSGEISRPEEADQARQEDGSKQSQISRSDGSSSARGVTRSKSSSISRHDTSDDASSVSHSKSLSIDRASSSSSSRALQLGTVNQALRASETSSPRGVAQSKSYLIDRSSSSSSARPLGLGTVHQVAGASETSSPRGVDQSKLTSVDRASSSSSARTLELGTIHQVAGASEASESRGVAQSKSSLIDRASSSSSARPLGLGTIHQVAGASEASGARGVAQSKLTSVDRASTSSSSRPLQLGTTHQASRASETASTRSLAQSKLTSVDRASSSSSSRPLQLGTVDQALRASETSGARGVAQSKLTSVSRPDDSCSARQLSHSLSLGMVRSSESSSTRSLDVSKSTSIGRPSEASSSYVFDHAKVESISRAQELSSVRDIVADDVNMVSRSDSTEDARPITASKSYLVTRSSEVSSTRPLSRKIIIGTSRTTEQGAAREFLSSRSTSLVRSSEVCLSRPISSSKAYSLSKVISTGSSRGLSSSRVFHVGRSTSQVSARPFVLSRTYRLPVTSETSVSRDLASFGGLLELDISASPVLGMAIRGSGNEENANHLLSEANILNTTTPVNLIHKRTP